MRRLALLVLASLGLSGCFGLLGETAQETSDAAEAGEAARETANATRETGEAGANATGAPANATAEDADAAPAPEAPPAPYAVDVRFEETFGLGPSVCASPTGSSMVCAGSPLAGGLHRFEPEVNDPLVSFNLTLTWDAASPATRELTLVVETCDQDACEPVSITGPSPLVLAVDDAGLRGNPVVLVRAPEPAPGVSVEDGTLFRVEGRFVAVDLPGGHGFAGRDGP